MAKEKEIEKAPAKSKKWVFIIGILVLILLIAGGGVGAYFLGAVGGRDSSPGPIAGQGPGELGPLVEVGNLVVNIPHRETTRFLKIGITLEVQNDMVGQEVQDRMPQIKDALLLLAGNKTFDDIKDLQGKLQLKADMLARINDLAGQDKVKALFFTDFVVQ